MTLTSYPITLVIEGALSTESDINNVLNLYPNPIRDFLTIKVSKRFLPQSTISIYDIRGGLVKKDFVKQGSETVDIDCSQLLPGLYLINYKNQELIMNRLVIKI